MAEPDRSGRIDTRTGALFERHARMVLGLCRLLLRDAVEAEDAVQQTFVNAHRALLAGAVVRDDAAWLAAIARNECRARIAARTREPLAVSDDELVAAAGAMPSDEPELPSEELRRALAALPERQREAVVLRDVYGLRYREVAVALGLSRPAVESLLFRARRRLRMRLRPIGGGLVLPFALRDSIAQSLTGLAAAGGAGPAGAGATGAAGVLAKLGGAPLAAKLTAGVVAVGAGAGSLAVAEEVDHHTAPIRARAAVAVDRPAAGSEGRHMDASPETYARAAPPDANHGERGGGERIASSGSGHAGTTHARRSASDGSSSGPGHQPEPVGDEVSSSGSGSNGSHTGHGSSGSTRTVDIDRAAEPAQWRSGSESQGSPSSGSESSGSGSDGSGSGASEPDVTTVAAVGGDSSGSNTGPGSSSSGSGPGGD